MRMTLDLGEAVRTDLGTFRYVEGECDLASHIMWPEAAGQGSNLSPLIQPEGRRVGIFLAGRAYAFTVDAPKPKVEAAPTGAKKP